MRLWLVISLLLILYTAMASSIYSDFNEAVNNNTASINYWTISIPKSELERLGFKMPIEHQDNDNYFDKSNKVNLSNTFISSHDKNEAKIN